MINVGLTYEDGQQEKLRLSAPFLIGRSSDCALRIQHWRVAKTHVRVSEDHTGCHLEDLGSLSGTRVNGTRLVRYGPVQPTDEIIIGPCMMRFTIPQLSRPTCEVAQSSSSNDQLESTHLIESNSKKSLREIRKSLHLGLIKALDLRRMDIAALSATGLRD